MRQELPEYSSSRMFRQYCDCTKGDRLLGTARTYLFAFADLNDAHVALGANDVTQQEALLFVGHPTALLTIVGLGLVGPLLL